MTRAGQTDWRDLRTVFLDRDGVLNEKAPEGEYVWRWPDFLILDGVPEAIARLNRAGIRVLVITNQRGVTLGRYTLADVDKLHAEFQAVLATQGARIDAFYVCPHGHGECNCRKPLPGMFEQAQAEFPELRAQTSVMIGDTRVDMEFGQRLGMRTILIRDGELEGTSADLRCDSLRNAVDALLGRG